MMGLGVSGSGSSSSSSSNLSPLAPPFTVDRPNPRPNSTQLMHFTEAPYAVPFQSSFQSWQYSQSAASRRDLYSNLRSEIDSIRTTCLPPADDYGYLISRSATSSSPHQPPRNPDGTAATDTFTYIESLNDTNIPSNPIEAQSYYPSFVPPVVDGDVPSVALNEPGYDIMSTSHVDRLDGASPVDYTQSLAGLEYQPQWGSFWNGFSTDKQGKRVELDGSFLSEDVNIAGSHVYRDYIKRGDCLADSLRKPEEASVGSHRKFNDVLGRENQIVPLSVGNSNDEYSSSIDPRFVTNSSSEISVSGVNSTRLESYSKALHQESATNFWKHQKPYNSSYDLCFQPLDTHINDYMSVKNSSPALVIREASTGPSSTVSNAVPSEEVKSVSKPATKGFRACGPSNQKDPHLPLNFDCKKGYLDTSQPSLHIEKSEHEFITFSSTRKEELSNKPVSKDILDQTSRAGIEFQLPNINVLGSLTLGVDTGKGTTSVEDSSKGFDQYNSAVDSPCWKGAPASPFVPSDVSEVRTRYLGKKLEECNNSNLQQSPICSPCWDDTIKVSCQNLYENTLYQENGYVELGSLLCYEKLLNADCPTKQQSSADAMKAGFGHPEPSCKNEAQLSNKTDRQAKQYDMPNDSINVSDLKPQTQQACPRKDEFISERELKSCTAGADTGLNVSYNLEPGSSAFCGTSTKMFTSSAEDGNGLAKLHIMDSTPKMNVQMLVSTLHNLSELLLYHCSNDACEVSVQDCEALKHAINNLDACVSKKFEHAPPMQDSVFPQQGITHECRACPDLYKDVIAQRPLRTKEADSNLHVHLGHHHYLPERKNFSVFGKEVGRYPEFVSLRDDNDIAKDDNMVQCIKEILNGNFRSDKELLTETSLYKNLWLEAEAALCSINYKARFDHMKIEMQKRESHEKKGVVERTMALDKVPGPKVSADPNITHKSTPEAGDKKIADNPCQDSLLSSMKVVDDVEDSVLARFQILKCRGENSNSVNAERQNLVGIVDTDFAGKRNPRFNLKDPSEDGVLDVSVEPHSHYGDGNCKADTIGLYPGGPERAAIRDSRIHALGDQVSCGNNRVGNQLPPGWYDSPSSDWEHVWKDEFASQN